jgi:ankyrin repeat protein
MVNHGDPQRMKHPLFEPMGDNYPHSLEKKYDRILVKMEELWNTTAIDDYFSDLLLDKRGSRKGFPPDALSDIVHLAKFREFATLRQAERKEKALAQLNQRDIALTGDNFLLAVESGDKELMDLFLRAGFSVHTKNKEGTPPLIAALVKGYTIIAQMLLKAGVEVNQKDKRGLTPLMLACGKPIQGYKAVAEALIEKGAFVNMRDSLGNTPLLLALSGGTIDIAELLIERGADLSAQTKDGESALSLVTKSGNKHLIDLIAEKYASR